MKVTGGVGGLPDLCGHAPGPAARGIRLMRVSSANGLLSAVILIRRAVLLLPQTDVRGGQRDPGEAHPGASSRLTPVLGHPTYPVSSGLLIGRRTGNAGLGGQR